jgi:hypothetical protein
MDNKNKFSRRKFLPLLGGTALLPIFGFTKIDKTPKTGNKKTLLKADGTPVLIDENVLRNAKIVSKNISNKSLLGWLKNTKNK